MIKVHDVVWVSIPTVCARNILGLHDELTIPLVLGLAISLSAVLVVLSISTGRMVVPGVLTRTGDAVRLLLSITCVVLSDFTASTTFTYHFCTGGEGRTHDFCIPNAAL